MPQRLEAGSLEGQRSLTPQGLVSRCSAGGQGNQTNSRLPLLKRQEEPQRQHSPLGQEARLCWAEEWTQSPIQRVSGSSTRTPVIRPTGTPGQRVGGAGPSSGTPCAVGRGGNRVASKGQCPLEWCRPQGALHGSHCLFWPHPPLEDKLGPEDQALDGKMQLHTARVLGWSKPEPAAQGDRPLSLGVYSGKQLGPLGSLLVALITGVAVFH